jgi:hypothetical protein
MQSTNFHHFTLSQEKILQSLAQFKYLSTGQLLKLGIMSDRANLNKQLALLKKDFKPLIGSIGFGVHPVRGKLESVHYLTKQGAQLLREQFGEHYEVRFPKGTNGLFRHDYFHRLHTIDIHICFHQWAEKNEMKLSYFRSYFDKLSTGKEHGYKAETIVLIDHKEYLIADALAVLETARRKELYAIEMYNGDDTQRVHQSLFAHLKALNNGQPSGQFGLAYGSRILCVFEWENYKQMAMKRLKEDARFSSAKAHFLFRSLEELNSATFREWQDFEGNRVQLF